MGLAQKKKRTDWGFPLVSGHDEIQKRDSKNMPGSKSNLRGDAEGYWWVHPYEV